MVATGAKSRKMIVEAANIVVGLLRETDAIVKSQKALKIDVNNVVASGGLGCRIDLEMTALLMENVMYEPDQFPGVIYHMNDPKAVLLLFRSGNFVCTGTRKGADVYAAIDKVSHILQEIDALEEAERPHS